MLRVPTADALGDEFHPVLVDDLRAAFALYDAGQRRRALRRFWRLTRDHDPRDAEALYYEVRHAGLNP